MRTLPARLGLLAAPVVALLGTVACAPDCPGPESVDGVWTVAGTVVSHQGGDEPEYPSYHSPINTTLPWSFAWEDVSDGPISVTLDAQPIDALGTWNDDACGAFTVALDGTYRGPTGTEHDIEATLDLVVWDETVSGSAAWSEAWTSRDGITSGTFGADGRLEGTRP